MSELGVTIRYPYVVAARTVAIPAAAFLVVAICNKDRGLPLAGLEIIAFLLFWTWVARRTTFGRHVYAVGGNAEAARRAGISVPRIRILVFMIAGLMSGLGGIVLAARLQSHLREPPRPASDVEDQLVRERRRGPLGDGVKPFP